MKVTVLASFLVCLASRCLCACDTMHMKKCMWTLEDGNTLVYVVWKENHFSSETITWWHVFLCCGLTLWVQQNCIYRHVRQSLNQFWDNPFFLSFFLFKTQSTLKRNSHWNNPLSVSLCAMTPWLHFVWIMSLHTPKSVNKPTCQELSFAEKTGPPTESDGLLLIRLNKLLVSEFSAEGLLKAETEWSQLCHQHCLRVTRQQRTFYLKLDEFCLHETEWERKREREASLNVGS